MDHSKELGPTIIPLIGDDNLGIEWKPRVGMEFDSAESAWKFWREYGAKVGFGVRKQWQNKNKKDGFISSCRFVCCKEGYRGKDKRDIKTINPRPETRTGCMARIALINKNGKFHLHEFVEEHNHILHLPETTHMLRCQRNISDIQAHEIDMAYDSGLQQRSSFQLMATNAGGRANLGYTRLDVKNYIRSKRQRSMRYGEAGCLLQYFQRQLVENPSFYHAYQMDTDEQMTNVFWADARMLLDYGYFGDVVSLDTTYCTNKEHRPLAIFSGFNHHRGAVIFGAALLYDETVESFKWLFETFLEAHRQKKPQTIFTDQDRAMARALQEVIPKTKHGLCTWHLMLNGVKHLGNLMKDGSHFLTNFNKCMYEYEEESQFEMAWSQLLFQYDVVENTWLRSMYTIKEKWAACYMKQAFTLGMRSTQLSESVNADLKACMNPDVDIIQFFKLFESVVEEKRYNELKCEFESREKVPRLRSIHSPMLRQLSQALTPTLFDLFQEEFDLFLAACIKQRNEAHLLFQYVVSLVSKEGEWRVSFNPNDNSICCSCRKFETFGILCCHALKVYEANDIKLVPEKYILKRWTREARSGIVYDVREKEVEEDPRLACTQRYRRLCPKLIRLATEVSNSEETCMLVEKVVEDLSKQIKEIQLRQSNLDTNKGDPFADIQVSETITSVKGFKKRLGLKRKKRLKSCIELKVKRKRKTQPVKNSQTQQSMGNEALSQMQPEISCSAPPAVYEYPQLSFTQLLMESLEHPLESLGVPNV